MSSLIAHIKMVCLGKGMAECRILFARRIRIRWLRLRIGRDELTSFGPRSIAQCYSNDGPGGRVDVLDQQSGECPPTLTAGLAAKRGSGQCAGVTAPVGRYEPLHFDRSRAPTLKLLKLLDGFQLRLQQLMPQR